MLVSEIIKQVRWSIDRESQCNALFKGEDGAFVDKDDTLLDNMIRAHIVDALHWCACHASLQLLNDSDTSVVYAVPIVQYEVVDPWRAKESSLGGIVTPGKPFMRLIMLVLNGWAKGVSGDTLTRQDSDEYAQIWDSVAKPTESQPKAVLVETRPRSLQVFPYEKDGWMTYISIPEVKTEELTVGSEVQVPYGVRTGFVYYIAYLVLSGMGDSNANAMLEIAKMNIGFTSS